MIPATEVASVLPTAIPDGVGVSALAVLPATCRTTGSNADGIGEVAPSARAGLSDTLSASHGGQERGAEL
jgi:hypothetical protein